MSLLDDPERFRQKLSDVFVTYWMTDVLQHGPAVLRKRVTELLDPPTIATIATGPHPEAAASLMHILPDQVIARASEWLAAHWVGLDDDVAMEALRKLADVSPDVAERLAIEHVARVDDAFTEDLRDGACVYALCRGSSEEGSVVAQQLVDRLLARSKAGLRSMLLDLCLARNLPGGPAAIVNELIRARSRRKLKARMTRLLDELSSSSPLDFRFVVESQILDAHPLPLADLRPLLDARIDVKRLERILRHDTSTPVAGLMAWARNMFGADDSSTPMRLLQEARREHGLDLEVVTLAATMFLGRLAVKDPPLGDLTLHHIVRIVAHPVDLGNLARSLAERLRDFPDEQALHCLRRFLGPGDEVDPMARFNALEILEALALPEAFDILLDQLRREPDNPAVEHAVDALVALGEPAGDRLVQRFPDQPAQVQIQVCRVLARTGGAASRALVSAWLPRASRQLRAELCDIVEFWPDPADVAVLEPAEPGADPAADYALVMMDLIHGIESSRTAARLEALLKEDDSFGPVTCPHCGHHNTAPEDLHADHDEDDLDDEVNEEDMGTREGAAANPGRPPIRLAEKIGRNDPCPCGSGKKYKKCCLARSDA